uniref:Exonuclease domain-containing protein n=1 Tax=Amphiprion ocellaris TaxID=80972 RepID=A0A3Q1CRI3_AMPOC
PLRGPATCIVTEILIVSLLFQPISTKRKLKQQQCEAAKEKVPHDVRQRYVSLFTEEFLKTTGNANDAFEKALSEERTVYNRSMNKLKYLSIAVNALKKMKNQSAVAAKGDNLWKICKETILSFMKRVNKANAIQIVEFNTFILCLQTVRISISVFPADDMALYESLKDYILTYEKLTEGNYPVQHPERHGCAIVFIENKRVHADPLKRICCRCGATYSVSQTGKHIRKEECNYHYGKAVKNRVPGGVETRYSCCEGVMGTPGCQMFKLHVHDSLSLDGFVSTLSRCPSDTGCPGIYSLDCEKCYTIHGLELSRVTVVNSSLQVVYDTFVRPDNEVIDYNTRFSGISEEDVKGNHTSLREVQETLLSFINADTILIGHGLETDLCLLKLLHGTVVDTSVIFPHRLGPPHKLTLNSLTAEYLRRIIQESVCGHDTAEDAAACMELMLWKVKEDGKMKKCQQ